jgi:glycosyltransferase involved in cell wall biosynthesis
MNITHVPHKFASEKQCGAETYVLETAKGLLERGHQTEIFTSAALSKEGDEEVQGISVHRFSHFYPHLGLSSNARQQLARSDEHTSSTSLLARMLAMDPPDLFHLHAGKRMGGIIRTVAKYHNRPYVVTLDSNNCEASEEAEKPGTDPSLGSLEWGRFLGTIVNSKAVLKDAAAILCVSKKEQNMLQEKYPGKRVEWIPQSVSVALFRNGDGAAFRKAHGIPASARVLLNVGGIEPQNNQLDAVEIFNRIAAEHSNTHLLLVGEESDASYAKQLKSAILDSSFSKQIHVLGALPAGSAELIDAYHASNVFLLCSVLETLAVGMLQAWAAGLPVVSANADGMPTLVEDCRNGLLYANRDISEAVSCVKTLLNNRAMYNTIRQNANESAEQFDSAHSMENLIHLYKAVVREHPLRT